MSAPAESRPKTADATRADLASAWDANMPARSTRLLPARPGRGELVPIGDEPGIEADPGASERAANSTVLRWAGSALAVAATGAIAVSLIVLAVQGIASLAMAATAGVLALAPIVLAAVVLAALGSAWTKSHAGSCRCPRCGR